MSDERSSGGRHAPGQPRLLVIATTTGYQTRSIGEAAVRQGIEPVFATDRCHQLDDPWRDGAVPVRFHEPEASVSSMVAALSDRPVAGVLALGDRPAALAARVARALDLPGHPVAAAEAARHKILARLRWLDAGLAVPWFRAARLTDDAVRLARATPYPSVVKPAALAASRGVIRADGEAGFVEAFDRLRRLLNRPALRAARDPAGDWVAIEAFIEGREHAVEAYLERGRFSMLALFDKPDPLDGPFFEETIYVTPSRAPASERDAIARAVERAASALGLRHGPLHAECRVGPGGISVLEVAARSIGGLCARALGFVDRSGGGLTLEDVLVRAAAGESIGRFRREPAASGVMMVPVPRRGYYQEVDGLDAALATPGVSEIRITAKPGQLLEPIPEGSSYLGFIFAKADTPEAVERALRTAHASLDFRIAHSLVAATD